MNTNSTSLVFKNQYKMCVLTCRYALGEMYGSVNQNRVRICKLYMYCIADIRHYHIKFPPGISFTVFDDYFKWFKSKKFVSVVFQNVAVKSY